MPRAAVLLFVAWLFGFGPAVASGGDHWQPIAPEVWAMKEDPAAGTVGAVILENRIAFLTNRVQYTYRARILSEQGRDAVEFPVFSSSAYGFDGRTVHADGTSVRLSEKTDFQSVTVKSRFGSGTVVRLVPPGVTGNCVVELRWYESAQDAPGPLPPEYGFFHEWELGGRYRTLLSVVDLGRTFDWAYELSGLDVHKPEVSGRVFTVRNLPALDTAPLSLPPLRAVPRLSVFWQPSVLSPYVRDGGAAYWNAVGRLLFKDYLGKVSKGAAYEAFAREMLAGLPPTPAPRAFALREKLDARIVNTDALTVAEKAARSANQLREAIEPADLGAAVRRGSATGYGMFLLFLNLAKDAGLHPTVALVTDREERLFRTTLLAPFQLDRYLVGITAPGKATLWLDPSMRFGSGTILPAYQGSSALELDTEAWTLRPISIPAQPAAYNVRRFAYELDLGEEGDQFKVKAQFNGYPDYRERWRFVRDEDAEQVRRLKESIEEDIAGAAVTHAQVDHARDPAANVEWSAEGRIEVEPDRRRTIDPFPAMPWPLWVRPAELSETRTMPIVLPYLQIHVAQTSVRCPRGYRLITGGPVQHSNSFGSVSLSLQTNPSGASAVLRVEITRLAHPAQDYGELKEFLAWIQDACGRTFVLEKE